VQRIIFAGRINSLAQTLIKLTAPGIPDIYQGSELWDMSLVDPDNRRVVPYDCRTELLAQQDQLDAAAIMARMDEGLPKLWLITRTLGLRREHPEWFGAEAEYEPLFAEGEYAAHVVAFMRGGNVITLVPRLFTRLPGHPDKVEKAWGNTCITLPPGNWRNHLIPAQSFTGEVKLVELLHTVPLALLTRDR
jgi:(1->4)-alpha-D-glucan 1-alpha-D-glucosylmutase